VEVLNVSVRMVVMEAMVDMVDLAVDTAVITDIHHSVDMAVMVDIQDFMDKNKILFSYFIPQIINLINFFL